MISSYSFTYVFLFIYGLVCLPIILKPGPTAVSEHKVTLSLCTHCDICLPLDAQFTYEPWLQITTATEIRYSYSPSMVK